MEILPEDNGDGTQSLKHQGEFWTCGWIEGDTELRDLTYEDEPLNKFIDGQPPEKWSGVTSWKEIEVEREIEGQMQMVTLPQQGRGFTSWSELVQFCNDNKLGIPPETNDSI